MAYTPTVWKNGEFPPIDAEHLNKIEQGIANSAPGGYGLGDDATLISADTDLNSITKNGWYQFSGAPIHAPTNNQDGWESGYSALFVNSRNSEVGTQTIFCSNTTSVYGCQIKRVFVGGKWYPWEWVNPPMISGIEYRTTERYLGKPVYVKTVDCGEITDGKAIDTGISWALKVDVISIQSSYSNPLPRVPFRTTAESLNEYGAAFYVNLHNIIFICGPSGAGGQAIAIIRYTKTTD